MAKEELIIEIEVEQSATTLADLRRDMDALIATRRELSEKAKAGDSEAAKEVEKLSSAIRNLNTDYKAQQRVLDGYNNSVKTGINTSNLSANSIQENRDLLKQLTAQYIQLKNPSANATSQLKHLSDVLKEQEAAIGNTTRNVGNYKEAITGAFNELRGVSAVIDPLRNMGLAFDSAGGGVKGFGLALAATGLPLFISGVNSLIGAFSDFKPIADAVEDIMAGLSASFTTSYSEGVKLARLKRDLEDADRDAIITNAELKKSINELEAQADNKAASEEVRINQLEQANAKRLEQLAIDKNLAQQAKEIADKEVEASEAKNRKIAGFFGTFMKFKGGLIQSAQASDEALKKQAEATAKLIELDDQFNQQSIANDNKIARLKKSIQEDKDAARDKELADQKKHSEELQKIEEERVKSLEGLAIKNRDREKTFIQSTTEGIEQRLALFEFEFEDRRTKLRDAGVSEARIVELYEKEKTAILQDEANKQAAIAAEARKREEQALKTLKDNAEQQLALQRLTGESQEQIDEEFANSSYKTFAEFYAAKKKLYEQDVANQATAAEEKRKIQEAEITAAQNIAGAFAAIGNAIGAQTAEGIAFQKIAAGIQLAINTAKSISAAIAGAAEAATATGPGAPFALIGYVASMVGTVVGAIAQATQLLNTANTPTPPKFAHGVIGLDGPGTETSDEIPAYLSKGESVLTAKATRKYHRELAWMEQSVGNSPNYQFGKGMFAGGFIPTLVHSDGGIVARDIARSSNDVAIIEAIKKGFQSAPKPVLEIVELNKKQDSRSRSIEISGM